MNAGVSALTETMQLSSYNSNSFPELSSLRVQQIAAAKLFYVVEGRNAWWSTWVQQYWEGCMHSRLEGAKDFAERNRVQGSVFYTKEQPALLFQDEDFVLAVTQINCRDVLVGYSVDAISQEVGALRKKIDGALDNYLGCGATFKQVYSSFERGSGFWKVAPPSRNSIIRVMCRGSIADFESLGDKRLMRFKSYSNGANYPLGWTSSEGSVTYGAVKALASSAR